MNLPWALACAVLVGASALVGSLNKNPAAPAAPHAGRLLGAPTVGVLLFLLWDVLTEAFLPLDGAIEQWIDGLAPARPVQPLTVGFFVGLVVGFAGLAVADASARRSGPLGWKPVTTGVTGAEAGQALKFSTAERPAPRAGADRAGASGWWPAAAWAARGLTVGLVLGTASSSEDLALSVLLVVGTVLAFGLWGRSGVAATVGPERWRSGVLGAVAMAVAVIGVLIGRGFPNDVSAVDILAASVGIWAAGTGALAYLVVGMLLELTAALARWVLYAGVVSGLAAAFGVNLLLMVASATA